MIAINFITIISVMILIASIPPLEIINIKFTHGNHFQFPPKNLKKQNPAHENLKTLLLKNYLLISNKISTHIFNLTNFHKFFSFFLITELNTKLYHQNY